MTTTERLAPLIPKGYVVVGESGLFTPADLARLEKVGVSTFLIGESLMRQKDVSAATKALLARQPRTDVGRRVAQWRSSPISASAAQARMVDVSDKAATERIAVAEGRVVMSAKTLALVLKGDAKKGDVLGAARIAGIMAAKKTHELIPLCHPLALTKVEVDIAPDREAPRPRSCARPASSKARPASRWRRSPPSRSRA